jgi:hypothetical protein
MAAPLYFFPRLTRGQLAPKNAIARNVLSRYGLDQTFADVADALRDAAIVEVTGHGPGGSSGCILTALPVEGEPPVRLGYFPDFQTWHKFGESPDEFYVGIDNEHPPTAADLKRKKSFDGYNIELAGETFCVPVIRDPEGGTGLPRDFVYADGGRVEPRIKAAYYALWEKFGRAVWLFFDPEGPWPISIDLTEGTDLCIAALAINYRIGRIEQNLLGLIDSETWSLVLMCATDYPTFSATAQTVEAQKKTRLASIPTDISPEITPPASLDSTPGHVADSPAIAPASAS